jgi:phosphatidylethanolamine-binding protein (PEBP) family uncharacterized protein
MRQTRKNRKQSRQRKLGGSTNFQAFYNQEVVKNQEFTKNQVTRPPNVRFQGEPGVLYTLILHDPDAPSAKIQGASWLHFLAINLESGNLMSGNLIMPYAPPAPPPGSGVHRYLFELYKQPDVFSLESIQERSPFYPEQFAKQHGIQKVAKRQFRVRAPEN